MVGAPPFLDVIGNLLPAYLDELLVDAHRARVGKGLLDALEFPADEAVQ